MVDYDTKNGIGVTVFFLLETGEQQIGRVPKKVKTLSPKSKIVEASCTKKRDTLLEVTLSIICEDNICFFITRQVSQLNTSSLVMEIIKS